ARVSRRASVRQLRSRSPGRCRCGAQAVGVSADRGAAADSRGHRIAAQPDRHFLKRRVTMIKCLRALSLVAGLLSAGCSLATGIRQNSEAIGKSTATISANTQAIQESTKGTTTLIPALQGTERLAGPLQALSGRGAPVGNAAAHTAVAGQGAAGWSP